MAYFATCHQCMTRFNLATLQTHTSVEPGTNHYEEDTVAFKCPVCGARMKNAIVTKDR